MTLGRATAVAASLIGEVKGHAQGRERTDVQHFAVLVPVRSDPEVVPAEEGADRHCLAFFAFIASRRASRASSRLAPSPAR